MDIADELHKIAIGIDQDFFIAAPEKMAGLLSVAIYNWYLGKKGSE